MASRLHLGLVATCWLWKRYPCYAAAPQTLETDTNRRYVSQNPLQRLRQCVWKGKTMTQIRDLPFSSVCDHICFCCQKEGGEWEGKKGSSNKNSAASVCRIIISNALRAISAEAWGKFIQQPQGALNLHSQGTDSRAPTLPFVWQLTFRTKMRIRQDLLPEPKHSWLFWADKACRTIIIITIILNSSSQKQRTQQFGTTEVTK